MKIFVVVVLAIVGVSTPVTVHAQACAVDSRKCTSRFSGYKYALNQITDITTQLLDQSFDFLFLSAAFDQHHRDRPGFEKLYRGISDRAWADVIALMKYQSKRGYRGNLNPGYTYAVAEWRGLSDPERTTEHGSLQLAVEYEKNIAEVAHAIHRKTSVAHQYPAQYDPDAAHFFDEQLIQRRSDSVRKLTGYVHILEGILNSDPTTRDLGLHMFDEYLASEQ